MDLKTHDFMTQKKPNQTKPNGQKNEKKMI